MKNRVYFTEWIKPYEQRCKDADVKLSNKNRVKLKTAWVSWCMREYGTGGAGDLNLLFWCMYAEAVETLVPTLNNLLSEVKPDKNYGSLYHTPVVLGVEHGVVFTNGTLFSPQED